MFILSSCFLFVAVVCRGCHYFAGVIPACAPQGAGSAAGMTVQFAPFVLSSQPRR